MKVTPTSTFFWSEQRKTRSSSAVLLRQVFPSGSLCAFPFSLILLNSVQIHQELPFPQAGYSAVHFKSLSVYGVMLRTGLDTLRFTLAGALKTVSEGSICHPIINPKPYLVTHGNGCGQARHQVLSYCTFIKYDVHLRLFHSKIKAGQRTMFCLKNMK